ncbi:hypothetical protein CAEBREN_10414 [Caenorhabditis brenneri]|uniref:Uncharacterized protein n=1 Tax=Caenorhabditis brenneri TaxID=135651 RepID=G0MCE9_CAEBE|nr:hypothetical protein CAEBREN_10414 [Caenorhabditis brenneri]
MSVEIEIPIKFKDQEETSILRDVNVVKQCPVIVRALEGRNPDWETKGIKLGYTLEVEMKKAAGDFVFTYNTRYKLPESEDVNPKLEDFADINEKTLPELKEIIEAASYLENNQFMNCVAFVIAQKLNDLTIEEIAEYFNVPYEAETSFFAKRDGWVRAPSGIF